MRAALRIIFASKRRKVMGGWRKFSSYDQIKDDEKDGACSRQGKDEK
jgi:hypothetical protein